MPVYNAEKYLRQAIESILKQTFEDFEFLIINDGSTDDSVKIIKEYDDSRIRLVHNEKNMGLPYTRERGLKLAEGEYIALMDADDISYANRLEEEVNYLDNNRDVMIVASIKDDLIGENIRKSKPSKSFKNINKENEEIKVKLMFSNVIMNPTAMIRKQFIIENNITYNKKCFVAQDYDFWVECTKYGLIHIIESSLLAYRFGHENITKRSSENKKKEREKLISNIREKAIKNCGIELNANEIETFNKVFAEVQENLNFNDFNDARIVLEKMIRQNDERGNINKKTFQEIIKVKFTYAVNKSNLNLIQKIKLIGQRFRGESLKSVGNNLIKIPKYHIKKKKVI